MKKYSEVNYLVICSRCGRAQVVHVDKMKLRKDQPLRGENAHHEQNYDQSGHQKTWSRTFRLRNLQMISTLKQI